MKSKTLGELLIELEPLPHSRDPNWQRLNPGRLDLGGSHYSGTVGVIAANGRLTIVSRRTVFDSHEAHPEEPQGTAETLVRYPPRVPLARHVSPTLGVLEDPGEGSLLERFRIAVDRAFGMEAERRLWLAMLLSTELVTRLRGVAPGFWVRVKGAFHVEEEVHGTDCRRFTHPLGKELAAFFGTVHNAGDGLQPLKSFPLLLPPEMDGEQKAALNARAVEQIGQLLKPEDDWSIEQLLDWGLPGDDLRAAEAHDDREGPASSMAP